MDTEYFKKLMKNDFFYFLVHLALLLLIYSNHIHCENNHILFNLNRDEDTEIFVL